ncbi:hypothetical protein J3R30DRAFT_3375675 [Lentinula aciculospora]|uniref:ZZ-type domain-containing protein n=1 Tax=Lentinula aciculospora TaxID=153920 RepID=A0A9W9DL28_9AGAR|nr:hypothetical protein J3R30DRAFT_3375675 [Lentinula aciculospora]
MSFVCRFIVENKHVYVQNIIHTALGVDSANTKLDSLSSQTESLQLTMSSILRKLDTPREQESQAFIENHGGPEACLQDNQLIKELIKISGEGLSSITLHRTGDDAMDMTIAREKLTREYARDLDQAFDKNLQLSQRKMEAQEKQLQTFFQDSLHTEAEHIISALTAGAHDRLVDVDMQALWKDNDWKGSVKARHFVLALQDFYSDKMSGSKGSIVPPILPTLLPEPPLSPVPLSAASTVASADWAVTSLPRDDSWALRYIGVAHVQPILEAVDDNGTRFVSIKEVNTFATSKPNGWSLPVWIAYWAAGWQVGLTQYKAKIHAVIREMYKIIDYDTRAESPQDKRALRANRKLIDQYLDDDVFHRIDLLLRSLHPAKTRVQDAKLKQVIDFYISSEQIRLEGYLAGVAYDIDTPATVPLVTGPGRIERISFFIMPFIYLLLKRHLKVFYIARTHVLDPEEFGDLTSSLENVFSALDERIASLEAIFKQTVPDVAKRLGNYAFGLLQLSYGDRLRKPNKNSLSPWEEDSSNIDVESEGEDDDEIARIPLSILKYGVKDTLESQIYKHSISTFDYNDNNPDTSRHFLSGYWAGNLWTQDWEEFYSTQGLFQISITNVNDAGEITGVAEAYQGLLTVSGLITSENHVRLVLLYEDKDLVTCEGSWNSERNVLSGTFTTGRLRKRKRKAIANDAASSNTSTTKVTRKKKETTTFLFTRTPAFAWRFHTPFGQLSTTPRARWAFACNAVLDLVRRRSGSWHYLRNRTGERTRFLELLVRREVEDCSPSNPLSAEEGKEHRVMLATIHPTDARFYYSLVPSIIEATYTDHLDCSCSKCDKTIIQSRLICLTCIRNDLSRGLDFCLECLELSKNTKGYKHVPSHAMLKVDSVILDGLLAWAIPEAHHVATRVKRVFRTKQSRINEAQQEGTKDARPKKSKRMETMCCCCGKEVNTPCWVCLFCTPDTYVCDECERSRIPVLSDGPASWHEHKDHLIRIHDAEEAEELSATDAKLSLVENRLVGVENQFIEFKGVVNERLSQLEDTLQKILLHVVPNDSPSQ